MRVVTWNIHNWKTAALEPNFDGLCRTLDALDADIVGLNEVSHPAHVDGEVRPALEALAARLGMHYVLGVWKRWPALKPLAAEGYGNAILSRWPILASASHHLSSVPGVESRGLLEARVLLPDQSTFTAYVLHLDYTDEEARVAQFRAARQWLVRDRNRPHILMGDINAITAWDFEQRPEEYEALGQHPRGYNLVDAARGGPRVVAQIEKAGYVDLYRHFHAPGARTHIPAEINLRIDYIFASKPLAPNVSKCEIVDTVDHVSDHRPVWVEIDMQAGRRSPLDVKGVTPAPPITRDEIVQVIREGRERYG